MEVVGYAEGEPLLTSPQWFLHTNRVVIYPSAFAVILSRLKLLLCTLTLALI